MDIAGYFDQVYRMLQGFFSPQVLDGPVQGTVGWLSASTLSGALTALILLLAAGTVLDLVLYWTRRDQRSLLRGLWQRLRLAGRRLADWIDSLKGRGNPPERRPDWPE